eukprot:TRINITY_DN12990_c0_g1_i1.p1 TRINITY_DN12990_c0_g1~~TRINITY_DN12990_c0_g1_i1.p1  ORF type:complete len:288 (+),score=118.28 TRINITY_DN12990_c0_g1_i1:459-1322(+)
MLVGEHIDFTKSIEIAQLALKHRPNRNQRQRIIAIVYSPLVEDEAQLVNLAKKAKKNSVAVDVVNIGVHENIDRLKAFAENVNNADNSHLVHVDIGAGSVADMVISSPINTAAMANNAGGMGDNMGNVDPNMDPELAEAIRQSLEEQKQMLQGTEAKEEKKQEDEKSPAEAAPQEERENGLTEEEELQQAILLSMQGKDDESAPAPQNPAEAVAPIPTEEKPKPKPEEKKVDLEAELLKNPDFVSELIEGLPEMTEDEKKKVISSLDKKDEKPSEGKDEAKKEEKKQ